MRKCFWKGLAVGIILLFIGTSAIPGFKDDNQAFGVSKHTNEPTTDWWPMFHHDPRHLGCSTSTAPNTNTVLWNFSTGFIVQSSPMVVDGKVYICSNKVYCLNALTGMKIWDYASGWCPSSPAVADGKLYVGINNDLVCLNATTGAIVWNYTTGDFIVSSPAVTNGYVYVGSWDHKVYCFEANLGGKIWDFTTGDKIWSSPAIADDKVIIGSNDHKVYCLTALTGTEIWNYTTGDNVIDSAAVSLGNVYIDSDDNYLYCLNATTGDLLWTYSHPGSVKCPALTDDYLYIACDDDIYCLDPVTGGVIWMLDLNINGVLYTAPALADGKMYLGSSDGHIYCLAGQILWNYSTGAAVWSSPAIGDGKVYIGSDDGKLYCFGDSMGNQPPITPFIQGPYCGKINTEYWFSLGEIMDPEGDQIYCLWDWGDGNSSGWLGPFNSGTAISESHTWSQLGSYLIKVKLKDSFGAESNWSEPLSIKIVELKKAFFFGTFNDFDVTEDLVIFQSRFFIILPSKLILYRGERIAVEKNCSAFSTTIFIIGFDGVAIL